MTNDEKQGTVETFLLQMLKQQAALDHTDAGGFRFLLEQARASGMDWEELYRQLGQSLGPERAAALPPLEQVAPLD